MDKLQKNTIVVSRHWDNPEISVKVYLEGIEVIMSLEDLCKSFAQEVSHPSLTMTRTKLEKNLLASIDTIVQKIKDATNQTE